MGAVYTDQDVVVDGDLVTGRSADVCHLFARTIIDLVAARTVRGTRLVDRLWGAGRGY
jgi:protease I